jgi:hypothetical protein
MCVGTPLTSLQESQALTLLPHQLKRDSTAVLPPLLRRRRRRQRRGSGHNANAYTNTVARAAAATPSAFRHHRRDDAAAAPAAAAAAAAIRHQGHCSRRSCSGGGSSGSKPTEPGRFGPALEMGRGRVGSDSDRVGPAPDAAESAYSQLVFTPSSSGSSWQLCYPENSDSFFSL